MAEDRQLRSSHSFLHPILRGVAYSGGCMSSNFGISALLRVFNESSQEVRGRVIGIYVFLVGFNILIALAAVAVQNFDQMKAIGGLIGTTISSLFLFLIAIINIVILVDIYRTFREVKNGGEYNDQTLDESLNKRGLMGRFFSPLLRMTNHSWKMYPIGLLFRLGFDTATEGGLPGVAAATARQG